MVSEGWHRLAVVIALVAALAVPAMVMAQEEETEEEPGTRILTVTSFAVPYTDQGEIYEFMRKYFLPGGQLNPNVISYRVMRHYYGSNGSEIVIMAEYEDLAGIEAPCGQPCDDYFEENAPPEEGEEGYEEFQATVEKWQKYYSKHTDQIYTVPMEATKIEGEMHGPVGIPEEVEEVGEG